MKKLILIIAAYAFCSTIFCQEIIENEIDEFTKISKKSTSWETLVSPRTHVKIRKLNDEYFLYLRMFLDHPRVFAIAKDAKFMFMLDNEESEILELFSQEHVISSRGAGAINFFGSDAMGVETTFVIPKDVFDALLHTNIKKIRIYTTDGYVDKDVKEKNAILFRKMFWLFMD